MGRGTARSAVEGHSSAVGPSTALYAVPLPMSFAHREERGLGLFRRRAAGDAGFEAVAFGIGVDVPVGAAAADEGAALALAEAGLVALLDQALARLELVGRD